VGKVYSVGVLLARALPIWVSRLRLLRVYVKCSWSCFAPFKQGMARLGVLCESSASGRSVRSEFLLSLLDGLHESFVLLQILAVKRFRNSAHIALFPERLKLHSVRKIFVD
jgi:hypothetical protein